MIFAFVVCAGGASVALAQEKPEEIPKEYIKEAEHFRQYCMIEDHLRRHYNCECLAASFLGKRIERGPEVQRTSIMMSIEGQCQDTTEAAAGQYGSCIGNTLLLPPGIDPEAYCTCYANTFGKIFEKGKIVLSPSNLVKVQTAAHMTCRKPGYAELNYGKPKN